MSKGTYEPALTTRQHECGTTLYRVGSERDLFCPACKERTENNTNRSGSGGPDE